jgi:hypothetical protein
MRLAVTKYSFYGIGMLLINHSISFNNASIPESFCRRATTSILLFFNHPSVLLLIGRARALASHLLINILQLIY